MNSKIEASIRIGIDVEKDDPNLAETVTSLSDEQVKWVASWLAGEGFDKSAHGAVTATETDLAVAFTEWDRRYREEPERFRNEVDHLLRGTPETYGEEAAPYLIALLVGAV